MKNAAGDATCDEYLWLELHDAGINVQKLTEKTRDEVPYTVVGELHGWTFRRAWYYWVAEGPALPFEYATPMHLLIGTEVRVGGDCGCPAPEAYCAELGGVDLYHIDTQEGLTIFAAVLRKWANDRKRLSRKAG